MEQFNSNTYKKQTAMQEFTHSCLGRIIILAVIACILLVVAVMTVPTDSLMRWQTEDNIRECLQDNDSIEGDVIDDYVSNIGRVLTHADTTLTDHEQWETFNRYNQVKIYRHALYSTARVHNNLHPEGVRAGIGLFGVVIPTVKYSDFLMRTGAVRGDYGKRLIQDVVLPDDYVGENPAVKPFHYKGNPDD